MRGRSSGAGGKRTEPDMQKTPADHAGGNMVKGSSVRRTKKERSRKNENFSEKFLFSITTVYSWENRRRLAKTDKKRIINQGRKPVKPVGIGFRYLPINIEN